MIIERIKQQATFITDLSHDLKIPTIAQIRALELLLKGEFGKLTTEQEEMIQLILESCKCLYKTELLLFSICNLENYNIKNNLQKTITLSS